MGEEFKNWEQWLHQRRMRDDADECTQRRGPSGSRKGITKVVLDFVGWVSQGMSVMFI